MNIAQRLIEYSKKRDCFESTVIANNDARIGAYTAVVGEGSPYPTETYVIWVDSDNNIRRSGSVHSQSGPRYSTIRGVTVQDAGSCYEVSVEMGCDHKVYRTRIPKEEVAILVGD
jgi:hypothetical protein